MVNIKIAIILSNLKMNGIQKVHIQLANQFIKKGFSVDFVVANKQGLAAKLLDDRINLIEVGDKGKLFFIPKLFHYIKNNQPTHIMTAYEDITLAAWLINNITGNKAFLLSGTHNALSQARKEGSYLKRIKYHLIIYLLRLIYNDIDKTIAVSQGLSKEMASLMHVPQEKIEVIYNPVIDEQFTASTLEKVNFKQQNKFVIGFFGRLRPQKNVSLLLEAFSQLHNRIDAQLLIVGEGEEETKLHQQCLDLNISKKVMFNGFVANPLPLIKSCDVIVLSSNYEGLGNILIEAMACGVQVISTNCPYGPEEILEYGQWGQLVEVNNAQALCQAIEKSLSKQFWVESELLQQRAQFFSVNKAVDRYLLQMKLGA